MIFVSHLFLREFGFRAIVIERVKLYPFRDLDNPDKKSVGVGSCPTVGILARALFSYKNQYYARKTFTRQRKRIARKVDNPRLLLIHFHTLRHWKATMEYAKTKDILHVMQLLGHKDIKTTLKYTQLIGFSSDEYMCRVAKTVEEATQLVEAGYEYVTELEGVKLFRKRK
jgi:integrase